MSESTLAVDDFFNKFCRTMGGHKNEYASILCSAFNTIVQVCSPRHLICVIGYPLAIYSSSGIVEPLENSEDLQLQIGEIKEAVEMATGSVAFSNIEATRGKFANLQFSISS